MKGSIVAASAALLGSASAAAAAHKAHGAFHLRGQYPSEDICTVYTTVYVYPSEYPVVPVHNSTVYVEPSSVYVEPTSEPCTETPVPETETTTEYYTEVYTPSPIPPYTPAEPSTEVYTPVPVPSKEVYTPEPEPSKEVYTPPPVYTPEPAPTSSKVYVPKPEPSKPADTPTYGGNGRIVTKGDKWAITYTPYTADGQCKSAGEVASDIKKISELGFTTIRSYSTDCGVFDNVVPECQKYGLKVIYGIFLEAGGSGGKGCYSEYANSQLQEIIDYAPKDSVAMIIVGNEALFNNYVTASELAGYITYVKKQLKAAGFPSDIAVTTTEPVGTWEEKGAALCSVIDVFTVQVHPYFTSKVSAGEAGKFAKQQLEQAAAVCPEAAAKGKYISEIGWPKSGQDNGNAHPGYAEQKEAIESILKEVGKESCLFSFQDDKWKNPGAFDVEQSFGCYEALY